MRFIEISRDRESQCKAHLSKVSGQGNEARPYLGSRFNIKSYNEAHRRGPPGEGAVYKVITLRPASRSPRPR